MDNISVGKKGEDLACNYLEGKGYKIIARNQHFSKYCEIDIIAQENDTIVFCEVKTRSSEICGSPLEAITTTKYKNIRNGVFLFLQDKPNYKKYRIDAISVILKPNIQIKHLKNI